MSMQDRLTKFAFDGLIEMNLKIFESYIYFCVQTFNVQNNDQQLISHNRHIEYIHVH